MRTSGSHLLVLGEFRRSLFDGTADSITEVLYPFLVFLDLGATIPLILVEPSTGPEIKNKKGLNFLILNSPVITLKTAFVFLEASPD